MPAEEPQTTGQKDYVKVANAPGLYRHRRTGRYYGVKKVNGKHREHSLGTSDRKIADRRFKEWAENLGKVDSEVEKTTLRQLIGKFVEINRGTVKNTQATTRPIIESFKKFLGHDLDMEAGQIRPSQLDAWLASQESRLRNTTYNRYAGFLKQLFELATKDRIIAESPCKQLHTPWKKPQTPVRQIPTIEQFQRIVDSIRSQPFSDHAQDSADFVEFLGLAGLGQAEASSLTWGDIDWKQNRIRIRRHKTDTVFYVPIYPHLLPLLERLKKGRGAMYPNARVFKIKDAKKSLQSACIRLGFPTFSQRNLRQSLIMRLWKAGVDKKLIAKWQGHRDGGQLIMDTYTEVFGDDDGDYRASCPPPAAPSRLTFLRARELSFISGMTATCSATSTRSC